MIDGVKVTPLQQFFDERGKVMHMMRNNSPEFTKFGEIYFSCTYPDAVKAWHLHQKMTLNYAVVHGAIKCVLYDDRPDSPTHGVIEEYFMSPENYFLLSVPPLVWNGWKGIGKEISIVANCSDIPHDPQEIHRKPAIGSDIEYDWNLKHK
jgi:dTDP-4-dehydrorhamnose 3,5-epimerase